MPETENLIIETIATLRPYLNMDGGDIEYIKYEDKYVFVKLLGTCSECDFADTTIQDMVFTSLKEEIPEIEGVINVEI